MFETIRENWQRLKEGGPRRRFQNFYDARQRERRGTWSPTRIVTLTAGVTLIVGGPVVGLVPGPGGMLVFALGLALLAMEIRPAARVLDWLEPKVRVAWAKAGRVWRRLPGVARIALSTLCLAMMVSFGYFAYSLMK